MFEEARLRPLFFTSSAEWLMLRLVGICSAERLQGSMLVFISTY